MAGDNVDGVSTRESLKSALKEIVDRTASVELSGYRDSAEMSGIPESSSKLAAQETSGISGQSDKELKPSPLSGTEMASTTATSSKSKSKSSTATTQQSITSRVETPSDADVRLSSAISGLQDYFRKPCFVHSRLDDAVDVSSVITAMSPDNFSHLSHSSLVRTATGVRELAKRIGQATIKVNLRSILIVTKARDNSLIRLTRELARWLILTRKVNVYVDAKLRLSKRFDADHLLDPSDHELDSCLRFWTPELTSMMPDLFDLVLTLGGDGTVLYTSWLFQHIVPPILAFSLGSLGFLTNFPFQDYEKTLNRVFDDGINVNLRMRFTCTIYKDGHQTETFEVINEIVIDRGPSPWISMLELYGNGHLLTVVQADGLILSTPTGSTAYSLSAGGSLVHPEIPAISVTPICPHTLSFRPMLLPDSMLLKVCVPRGARNTAWASFDGRHRVELRSNDYVTVTASQYPFPTVTASTMDYIESVSRTLKWNVREQQKPFSEDSDGSTTPVNDDEGADDDQLDDDWDIDDSAFFSSSSSSTALSGFNSAPQSAVTTGSSSPLHRDFLTLDGK
ncbi:ATP-NAD kinase-like domain-containing protein [Lipomyces oligophaga]|uniref:ATP-NAD kinase-like domain-containing protein n=1 Tax=Lipomyces oligophaga TaxID=45792 RepID=UPI0034CFC85B